MPFGGSSPPGYEAPTTYLGGMRQVRAVTPFAETQSSFGNARSDTTGKRLKGKNNIRLTTITKPKEFVQNAIDSAGVGLNSNMDYLNLNPQQRFEAIIGGNDLYYNVLSDQLKDAEQKALGRARIAGSQSGLANSTTQGAAVEGIINDSLRREREAQLAAFNLGQQTSTNNVGTSMGVLSGINNILSPVASQTGSQLGQLRQAGEQINMQNAQNEYQSAMAQYNAKQQGQSGLFNFGSNIAGAALPFALGGMGGISGLANGASGITSGLGSATSNYFSSQLPGLGGFSRTIPDHKWWSDVPLPSTSTLPLGVGGFI